jgi:hypothetical protein
LRRRDDRSFVTAGAVLGHRLLDRVQQILIANRFGQELDRAGLHGANRHRDIGSMIRVSFPTTCQCQKMMVELATLRG